MTSPAHESSIANRTRVRKGVSEGGQFSAEHRSEDTSVSLGKPATEQEAPTGRFGRDQTPTAGAMANQRLEEITSPEKFLAMAKDAAEYWQRRYDQASKSNTVSADDIAQETMLQVMIRLEKGSAVSDFRQLVSSVAANVTVRATQNKFRAEDRRAYRQFTDKVGAYEAKTGRTPSQKEQDVLAQEVLDEWHDPRHRPTKDFRTPLTVDASLDRPIGEGSEVTPGSLLASPETPDQYIEPGSFMDRAFDRHEAKGVAPKSEAKRLAWNAVAERNGTPLSQEGSLSQRKVTEVRRAIDERGGALAASRDYDLGLDNEATQALFAPFGEVNDDQKDQIVDMLTNLGPEYGEQVWQGAAAYANSKHLSPAGGER